MRVCIYACFLNMFFIHYLNIYAYTNSKEHTQEKYALKDVKLKKKSHYGKINMRTHTIKKLHIHTDAITKLNQLSHIMIVILTYLLFLSTSSCPFYEEVRRLVVIMIVMITILNNY